MKHFQQKISTLNIFYCQNIYSNGVGPQVLTTLVSNLPPTFYIIKTHMLIKQVLIETKQIETYTGLYLNQRINE